MAVVYFIVVYRRYLYLIYKKIDRLNVLAEDKIDEDRINTKGPVLKSFWLDVFPLWSDISVG